MRRVTAAEEEDDDPDRVCKEDPRTTCPGTRTAASAVRTASAFIPCIATPCMDHHLVQPWTRIMASRACESSAPWRGESEISPVPPTAKNGSRVASAGEAEDTVTVKQ